MNDISSPSPSPDPAGVYAQPLLLSWLNSHQETRRIEQQLREARKRRADRYSDLVELVRRSGKRLIHMPDGKMLLVHGSELVDRLTISCFHADGTPAEDQEQCG
jgi:hypothetical protein